MQNVTISAHTADLFIIHNGEHVSCLGFDYATRTARGVADWLAKEGQEVPAMPARIDSVERYAIYADIMARGAAFHAISRKQCEAELTPELRGLEGRRVEVETPDGEKARFWVGRSTGWLPIHLEIKSRNSSGGCAAYVPEGSRVSVIGKESR